MIELRTRMQIVNRRKFSMLAATSLLVAIPVAALARGGRRRSGWRYRRGRRSESFLGVLTLLFLFAVFFIGRFILHIFSGSGPTIREQSDQHKPPPSLRTRQGKAVKNRSPGITGKSVSNLPKRDRNSYIGCALAHQTLDFAK